MNRFKIFSNGELINIIIADEEFCKNYCDENSYTYETEEESRTDSKEPIIETEQLRADIDYIAIMTGVEL